MFLNLFFFIVKNKKLIGTVKHILEVFPEGVIIRGDADNVLNKDILFVNHSAQKDFQLDVNNNKAYELSIKFWLNDWLYQNRGTIIKVNNIVKYYFHLIL